MGVARHATNQQQSITKLPKIMSHEIQEFDTAFRPQSAKPSWHKLEKVIAGEIISPDQIPEVAFDVELQTFPLPPSYVMAGQNCSKMIVAKQPNRNIVIATASPEYKVFSNRDILERVFEAFAANNIPARLSFALTIRNCSMVSYSFEVENASEFFCGAGKDRHQTFVNFVSSHDKTSGLKGFGSATRTVCANTIQMALRGQKELFDFTFFHSQKGKDDFKNLPKLIEATQHHAQAFSQLAEQLGNIPINMHQAKVIALQILESESKSANEKVSVRNVNSAISIAELFKFGKGNSGQSMFDLLNGATEYYTSGNGSGGKTVSAMKKAYSADYGTAADKKVKFLQSFQQSNGDAISQNEIAALVKEGEALLKQYELASIA